MFTPCFNYTYFHGIGQLVINTEMADLLSTVLTKSEVQSPALASLAKELLGEEIPPRKVETDQSPNYDIGFFQEKGLLAVNRAMATLLVQAIYNYHGERPDALWSLYYNLDAWDRPVVKPQRREFAPLARIMQ